MIFLYKNPFFPLHFMRVQGSNMYRFLLSCPIPWREITLLVLSYVLIQDIEW